MNVMVTDANGKVHYAYVPPEQQTLELGGVRINCVTLRRRLAEPDPPPKREESWPLLIILQYLAFAFLLGLLASQ